MRIKLFGTLVVKEKAGILAPVPMWVCFHSFYMYEAPTFPKLIWKILTEWRNERNIVG